MKTQVFLFLGVALVLSPPLAAVAAEAPLPVIGGVRARPKPKPLLQKADVILEWKEVLDDCSTEKICVQGGLYNQGGEPAPNVRLRIDIGSHNLSKPRRQETIRLDQPLMNPGDRQEFYFELDRKIPYKNRKGEAKILEVGKYNFRVVPVWASANPPAKPTKSKK